jgi:hypothetical protein
MDLRCRASHTPNEEGRDVLEKVGAVIADVTGIVQFGHYIGWVQLNDRRVDFDQKQLWGSRYRSWCLRVEARTDESHPPATHLKPLLFRWACAQFKDRAIHFILKETVPGQTRFFVGDESSVLGDALPSRTIVQVEHGLQWADNPYSQHLSCRVFKLRYADVTQRNLKLRALPGNFYLKAGMYGGLGDWFQGSDMGPLHFYYASLDHSDATRRKMRSLSKQVMEFGIDGQIGYGTIQGGVSAGSPSTSKYCTRPSCRHKDRPIRRYPELRRHLPLPSAQHASKYKSGDTSC